MREEEGAGFVWREEGQELRHKREIVIDNW
jgi:hypothetical protein